MHQGFHFVKSGLIYHINSMTRNNIFGLLFTILCISGCISCNKYLLSEKDKEIEKEDIPIEVFEAISNIDLSARKNWVLIVNYESIYDYAIDKNTLKAIPKDTPCYIWGPNIIENEDGIDWISPGLGPIILFASQNYYANFISYTDTTSTKIFDQTTEDKLLAADCLSCLYSGKVSTHLSDILVHNNCLLDFELKNVPESTTVMVKSRVPIQPFRYKTNPQHYKAIVFSYCGERDAELYITMYDKIHIVKLLPKINRSNLSNDLFPDTYRYTTPDTYYKFTLSYDEEKDVFSIEDAENSVWSQMP